MGLFLGATELSTGGGGGGGFTKMNKYSTSRALGGDTVIKQKPAIPLTVNGNRPGNSSFAVVRYIDSSFFPAAGAVDYFVGYVFYWSNPNTGGTTTNVITSSTINYGAYSDFTITFTPNAVQSMTTGNIITTYAPPITVNPATDLGLADGASLGYFMVGGGRGVGSNNDAGGNGGAILQGTAIITTASTDLVLTPGIGGTYNTTSAGTQSTISGGLTLTSGDGTYNPGAGAGLDTAAQPGILGYGQGGKTYSNGGSGASGGHGFGNGSQRLTQAGDGAILLYY